MKRFLLMLFVLVVPFTMASAQPKQNRGLLAFVNGNEVQVSWRMRATDDPFTTKYKLYANGTLCQTLVSKTTVRLSKSAYASAKFSLVVEDANGHVIDTQDNVSVLASNYLDIPLLAPVVTNNGFTVTYSPGEGSAYDMDGDGEQEIILKWMPSVLYDGATQTVGREYIDCYKLNGTRLWRIDLGQNVGAGNNLPFMCYDFDLDGKGELIVKTAPGSYDAQGKYVGATLKGYADRTKLYYRGSDGLPTQGEEWMTCFDGTTGKELGTVDYWPLFGIQSNWYPGGSDTYTYGRRGNGFKGAVIYTNVDGKRLPCCYSQRGIYSYVYASAYSWDGKTFKQIWRHSSDQSGQGLFGEGAHSVCAGDVDGDGYDEVVIGAACIDHDGKLKWRTGLGHGDALHLGEFNPYNKGLEVYRITEYASAYDACLMDAATGKILASLPYQNGDVDRGIIMDVDSAYAGNEFFCNSYGSIYDCQGNAVYAKDMGNNNGYPNFRIYWDGDLLDEHFSGNKIAKYNTSWQGFDRIASLWNTHRAQSINGTKENAILMCDLLGDWREELILYTNGGDAPAGYDYALRIITTNYNTEYKLPWLRDDHNYDLAIAWQNVGYCQPPHLSYNPVEYYASLMEQLEDASWTQKFIVDFEDDDYSMWRLNNTGGVTQSIATVGGSKAFDMYATSTRNATFDFSTYNIGECEKYRFEFDWGTGGSNTDASSLVINADNAEGKLAVVDIPKYKNTTITFRDAANNEIATHALGNDYNIPSSLYHFTVTGSADGVYMTVTRGGEVVVNNAKLSDSYVMVTGLTANMGRSYNHTTFDNISMKVLNEGVGYEFDDQTYYIYNEEQDKFLSRQGTAAYADEFGLPVTFEAKSGTHTYALKQCDTGLYYGGQYWTSTENAKGDASQYEVEEVDGKEGVYYLRNTTNPAGTAYMYINVEDANNTNRVANNADDSNCPNKANSEWRLVTAAERNAIIAARDLKAAQADAAQANLAISSFNELSSVAVKADCTSAIADPTFGLTAENNVYEVYQNTANLTQTATGLGKGLYRLTIPALYRQGSNELCQSMADQGMSLAYIQVGDQKIQIADWASDATNGNNPNNRAEANAKFQDDKYQNEVYFYIPENDGSIDITIATPVNVPFGWLAFGEVKLEKLATPSAEALQLKTLIDAAQAVADEYADKVGTQAFKYPITVYNDLQIEIAAATELYESDEVTDQDVEDFRTRLEAAMQAMLDAQVNPIDPYLHYYLIQCDNDGVSSGLYLDMTTTGADNLRLSATPHEIRLGQVGETYEIINPEDNCHVAAHNDGANQQWGSYSADTPIKKNSQYFKIVLQDDGTVTINNSAIYDFGFGAIKSITEGAEVTCYTYPRGEAKTYAISNKWKIVEAPRLRGDVDVDHDVDMDDVTLLKKILLGQEPKRTSSDVDEDGRTSVRDLPELINILRNQK